MDTVRRKLVMTLLVSSTLIAPLAALAQTPAPEPTTPAAAEEETLVLSPFEVTTEANRGYVSSESMTGSRVAVKILDLPYTVNVLTSEFFADFGMFELADNLTQIGNFTGLDVGGGFNLRGFSSSSQLRDGFYRLGRYGSSNIDRMEIIKGSNAAIYGRTSPGGMINMISKQPKARESQSLTLSYGNFNTQRGVLETTGPLFKSKFGTSNYILTLSQYSRGFDQNGQDFARNRNNEAYLAVKHTFPDSSTLFASAEYFHQTRHAPPSSAPLVIDNKGQTDTVANLTNPADPREGDDVALGYAKNLAGYNAFGPNSELNRGNTSFSFVYEKKLSSILTTRVAGNYFKARRWDYNQNTGWGAITYNKTGGATPTSARGATPNKGLIFEDGGGVQADLLGRYKFGNISNQTLLTIDVNDYYRFDPTYQFAAPGGNVNGVATVRTDPTLLAWDTIRTQTLNGDYTPAGTVNFFPSWFQWGKEYVSRTTKRRTTSWGGLLRHQTNFFDDTLLTFVGARFDRVEFRHRDYLTPRNQTDPEGSFYDIPNYVPGQLVTRTVNELKPNAGVNYKLTKQLRVFVNYSESYFVNQTENVDAVAKGTYKSEVADGWDYGFKGEFLDERLNFTVSGFYATRENVRVTESIEFPVGSGTFINVSRLDGNQLVRGVEADVTWRVDDSITTGVSYGHTNSIYTDFGSANPQAKGRKVNNISPHNGSAYVKWAPGSGMLKGFSANLSVTYVSATRTEGVTSGDLVRTVNGQSQYVYSNRAWALEVPSFTLWNAGVRYNLKGSNRIDHTFALNVNNILDEDYLKVNKQIGERRGVSFTYTIARY